MGVFGFCSSSSTQVDRTGAGGQRPSTFKLLAYIWVGIVVLLVIGGVAGCGDDLPPGILPAQIISFEPTRSTTSSTSTTRTPPAAFAITLITPAQPTAGSTVTISFVGLPNNLTPTALGLEYQIVSETRQVISSQTPTVQAQRCVVPVLTVSASAASVLLPPDIISGPVNLGGPVSQAGSVGLEPACPSIRSGSIAISNLPPQAQPFNVTVPPLILSFSGGRTAGQTFVVEATGLSPRLDDIRLIVNDGIATTTYPAPDSVTFVRGSPAKIVSQVFSSDVGRVESITLQVGALSSPVFFVSTP